MATLITQAQWERAIGAARVADLCDEDGDGDADSALVTDALEQGSSYVEEFADAAGVTLSADTLTGVMRRRVAMCAAYFAAERLPEYRDSQGHNPYRKAYETCTKELETWSAKTASDAAADESVTAAETITDDATHIDDGETTVFLYRESGF